MVFDYPTSINNANNVRTIIGTFWKIRLRELRGNRRTNKAAQFRERFYKSLRYVRMKGFRAYNTRPIISIVVV